MARASDDRHADRNGDAFMRARLAIAPFLGVGIGLVVTQAAIGTPAAVLKWMVAVLLSGVVINSQRGYRSSTLWMGALAAGAAFLAFLCFLAAAQSLGRSNLATLMYLSGVNLNFQSHPLLCMSIFFAVTIPTVIALRLALEVRPLLMLAAETIADWRVERIRHFEKVVNALVVTGGTLWLAVSRLI